MIDRGSISNVAPHIVRDTIENPRILVEPSRRVEGEARGDGAELSEPKRQPTTFEPGVAGYQNASSG
jgi:hypothetical protein